jgi:dTDP-4-dehydrorhamnose 3,5-epimerase
MKSSKITLITPILGQEFLQKKSSLITAEKKKSVLKPIHDLLFLPTIPITYENGLITDVARIDQKLIGSPIVQVHLNHTLAGKTNAWGLHKENTDRLFLVSGQVKFAIFDGRENSPTYGAINEFFVSDRSPGLLIIPPNLYHGWKNIGNTDSIIINMPSYLYDYENPDAYHLDWDSEAAKRLIKYQF